MYISSKWSSSVINDDVNVLPPRPYEILIKLTVKVDDVRKSLLMYIRDVPQKPPRMTSLITSGV